MLATFEGCPTIIEGGFSVEGNCLKSFKHAPRIIRGTACFASNKFQNLVGLPEVLGKAYITGNNIKTLENSTKTIRGKLFCDTTCGFLIGNEEKIGTNSFGDVVISEEDYVDLRRPYTEREDLIKSFLTFINKNGEYSPADFTNAQNQTRMFKI